MSFPIHFNIGLCIGGESLKCYSCMFPNDSWCKDVANLKFREAIITQQNCPDHVKNCGYTEIGRNKLISRLKNEYVLNDK